MSKNNKAIKKLKEPEEEFDFDFDSFDEMDQGYNENMFNIAQGIMESTNHQMIRAMELTKLAIDKKSTSMNEDEVFSIFKKAMNVIEETYPLKSLWKNLAKE